MTSCPLCRRAARRTIQTAPMLGPAYLAALAVLAPSIERPDGPRSDVRAGVARRCVPNRGERRAMARGGC